MTIQKFDDKLEEDIRLLKWKFSVLKHAQCHLDLFQWSKIAKIRFFDLTSQILDSRLMDKRKIGTLYFSEISERTLWKRLERDWVDLFCFLREEIVS